MAWRPNEQFVEGVLDNTVLGKVTGWMKFTGIKDQVILDLEGDFHRDIRGAKVRLRGEGEAADQEEASRYLEGFSSLQKGKVGDMTAGREPRDYVNYPYWEWYSEANGRVVIELEPDQVEILTPPIPTCESDPVSRQQQAENMAGYLCEMAAALNLPASQAVAMGDTAAVEQAKKVLANDRVRGMKLLPREIRELLPPLYAQENKGGKAIAYLKLFTPDSGWTWWITEGQPVLAENGQELDFEFFGLVEGQEKELGYFVLSELEEVRGSLGLPIERDLHWKPTTLDRIAPELFTTKPDRNPK